MKQLTELLNKLKLYSKLNKKVFSTSVTNFKYNILTFLKLKGYIKSIVKFTVHNKSFFLIELNNKPINTIYFFNSSYKQNYITYLKLLKWVRCKYLVIITTSKGILSASTAYKLKIGGQLLCYIKTN